MSKLFSDPIITTSEALDNDDLNLEDNNVNIDLDKETPYDKESDDPDNTLTTTQIFTTEPVPTSKVNTQPNKPKKEEPISDAITVNEYEDEPKSTGINRTWIIIALIAAVVIICLGWFIFARPKDEVKNESDSTSNNNQTEQTQQPTKDNQNNNTQEKPESDNFIQIPEQDNNSSSEPAYDTYNGYNSGNNNNYNGSNSNSTPPATDSESNNTTPPVESNPIPDEEQETPKEDDYYSQTESETTTESGSESDTPIGNDYSVTPPVSQNSTENVQEETVEQTDNTKNSVEQNSEE